ncbi:MAG: protein translocase subunit SecD [Candidatus Latescibacter sp.]|nr:protein translocase subunit SecD [Candidatus Latescibacter sp.]
MVRKTAKLRSSSRSKYSMIWRVGLIVLLILASLWELYPSLRFYRLTDQERSLMDPGKLEKLRTKALNLGLDLQGGIHLVMQVDTKGIEKDKITDAVDRAITVISNRVDQFGLVEPIVQRQGTDRIIIELPGMRDVERAKKLIGTTARLEFKLLKSDQDIKFVTDKIDLYLSGAKDSTLTSSAVSDTAKVLSGAEKQKKFTGMLQYTQSGGEPSFDMLVKPDDVPRVKVILADPNVQKILQSAGDVFLWGPDKAREDGLRELFLLNAASEMTGDKVADAKVSVGSGMSAGQSEVQMENTKDGAREWARITGANIGKRLSIVLDNTVYSSPKIIDRIPGGTSQITGSFTNEEARDLALVLRSGALPASVEILEDRTVGPSLGADSIRSSKNAFIIAMVAIIAFMLIYYMGQGTIAIAALFLNALFILAYLAFFRATLTLPGMAGIILTMGMAVDANVLVFERIREELRLGNTSKVAVDNGYFRARWSILDSNITTFLTGIILYNFGTGPIKGFALTLMVGIVSTVFTALVASKVFTDLLTLKLHHISVGKLAVFKKAKFPFIRFRKWAYLFSGVIILSGIGSIIYHGGPKYSIDFLGGSLIELHFDKPVQIGNIRSALGKVDVKGTDLSTSEIQFLGKGGQDVLIRIIKVGNMQETSDKVKDALRASFVGSIPSDETKWVLREEMVGPSIGSELRGKAWWAIIWSLVVLLIYISIRFDFKFGLGAVISLLHDPLIVLGLFSILGKEISLTVIAAILAIMGYSINDTIVVFDRIREKIRKGTPEGYLVTLDRAINETLSRTTITSFLTLLTVLSIFFFGGAVIHDFSFALIIGIVIGTYSSIYVATPVVAEWYLNITSKKKK